jgi:short-subunit dehydrogenase
VKKIVIVGATSLMAESCARIWLERAPARLVLIGRRPEGLDRVASDLKVRSPESEIESLSGDLIHPESIAALVQKSSEGGVPDAVLIAQGALPEQAECEQDLALCQETLLINGVSPVLWAEAFIGPMQSANHGTLAILGSVAGDRGRQSNYVYGSAKGLVSRYAEGLQHRLSGTKVRVVLVKPGPTDTPMTSRFKAKGMKLASVDFVAQGIVRAMDRGIPVAYLPAKWGLIMTVIRHLPRFIFNRLKF